MAAISAGLAATYAGEIRFKIWAAGSAEMAAISAGLAAAYAGTVVFKSFGRRDLQKWPPFLQIQPSTARNQAPHS